MELQFLILYFSHRDEIYYMRYEEMLKFWNRGQNGGRKHFKYEELNPKWIFNQKRKITWFRFWRELPWI